MYGASVTLVTTSSLDLLAEHTGGPVDAAQFRATFTRRHRGLPRARRGRLGRPRGCASGTPRSRCAASCPAARSSTSTRRPDRGAAPSCKALGGYRQHAGEVVFGVDAVVTSPGRVDVGAHVREGLTVPYLLRVELPDVPGSLGARRGRDR